jgi:hypothetical protein
MTYKTLISKINTIVSNLDKISKVYSYPVKDIEGYPAVIFFPDVTTNRYENTTQNYKEYRVKMWIVVAGTSTVQEEDLFTDILPDAVDQVIEALDDGWSMDGDRRTWLTFDSGVWSMQKPEDGPLTATAELDITVKTLTNVD